MTSLAFSPDALTLASSSGGLLGGTLRTWDVKSGRPKVALSGKELGHPVAYSPDGTTLATGSIDRTVRLWGVDGRPLATWREHGSAVFSVAFSPDGTTLASGAQDNTVRLWDVRAGESRAVLKTNGSAVWSLAFSPDGKLLAAATGRTVRLWDAGTGQLQAELEGHTGKVNSLAFSRDGRLLATASEDQTVRLWDVQARGLSLTLRGHTAIVQSVAFGADADTLASGSGDKTVRLWDVRTGQARATLPGHSETVRWLAFSPDGFTLASGAGAGEVFLWDLTRDPAAAALPGRGAQVVAVAFSPDGRFVYGDDRTDVRAWSVADRIHAPDVEPPELSFSPVALAPGSDLLAEARGPDVFLKDLRKIERDRERRLAMEPVVRQAWHGRQAAAAEKEKEWFVATFHLGQLLKEDPNNADLKDRHKKALERLRPPEPMRPLPRP